MKQHNIQGLFSPVLAALTLSLIAFAVWQPLNAWGQAGEEIADETVRIPENTTSGEGEALIAADSVNATADRDLFSIVQEGGPLMLPILVSSVILLLFVFERTISLRRRRVIPKPFVKKFLHQLREGAIDQNEALELCEKNGSPVADVFAAAIKKWGRTAVEVEQAILDAGERATNGLRKYLRLLNGVATVSPLLGLLGTVVGMITAFSNIAAAQKLGRPELLAGGISQALLTTAAGLTVAIPALIFYMFFISRVDRLVMDIDALGQELVEIISADAEPAVQRKASRRKAA